MKSSNISSLVCDAKPLAVRVAIVLCASRWFPGVYRDAGIVLLVLLRPLAWGVSSCLSTLSFLDRLGLYGGAVACMPYSDGVLALSAHLCLVHVFLGVFRLFPFRRMTLPSFGPPQRRRLPLRRLFLGPHRLPHSFHVVIDCRLLQRGSVCRVNSVFPIERSNLHGLWRLVVPLPCSEWSPFWVCCCGPLQVAA